MTDFAVGQTLDIKFTTRQATGAPTTLAGSPAVAAYEDNSTTEITAGITLSVDFDSRTGLNNVRVVATGGNGYSAGKSYALVITAGTVNSVSVVGEVVGEFTLERDASFGRLGAPAGANVSADVAAVKALLPSALVSGRIDASVGAMAANVLTATAINADAITAAKIANGAIDAATFAAGAVDATAFAQGAADKVWSSATRTLTSLGNALVDELFKRDLSAITGEATRSFLNVCRAIRNKWSITGTTLTVTKEDDATTAWTATLTESVGANPYSAQDPD